MSKYITNDSVYYVRSQIKDQLNNKMPWAFVVEQCNQNPFDEEMKPGLYRVCGWGREKRTGDGAMRYNIPSWSKLPYSREYFILSGDNTSFAITAEIARELFTPLWTTSSVESVVVAVVDAVTSESNDIECDYDYFIEDSAENAA